MSIDARDAEGRYLVEPSDGITPERLFERDWAVTILDLALRRMAEEARLAGRSALFERLRDTLAGGPGAVPLAEVAADLQMTEAAVKKAAQRLRKRYSAVLREEIADTLDDPSDEAIEEEIRTLFAALGA